MQPPSQRAFQTHSSAGSQSIRQAPGRLCVRCACAAFALYHGWIARTGLMTDYRGSSSASWKHCCIGGSSGCCKSKDGYNTLVIVGPARAVLPLSYHTHYSQKADSLKILGTPSCGLHTIVWHVGEKCCESLLAIHPMFHVQKGVETHRSALSRRERLEARCVWNWSRLMLLVPLSRWGTNHLALTLRTDTWFGIKPNAAPESVLHSVTETST
jgi:hypothetical protein